MAIAYIYPGNDRIGTSSYHCIRLILAVFVIALGQSLMHNGRHRYCVYCTVSHNLASER